LGISPKTVVKHRMNLLEKAGVDSVVALLRMIGPEQLSKMVSC